MNDINTLALFTEKFLSYFSIKILCSVTYLYKGIYMIEHTWVKHKAFLSAYTFFWNWIQFLMIQMIMAFCMMYSAYELNKQGDSRQP